MRAGRRRHVPRRGGRAARRRGPSAPAPTSSGATRAATRARSSSTPSQRAAARGDDLVLGDTAGRLHTKTNLMEELRKVRRVAAREPAHVTEVLLVIDATTGQNGLNQARQFAEATEVTGVVLTKLDGSAKGGIVFADPDRAGHPGEAGRRRGDHRRPHPLRPRRVRRRALRGVVQERWRSQPSDARPRSGPRPRSARRGATHAAEIRPRSPGSARAGEEPRSGRPLRLVSAQPVGSQVACSKDCPTASKGSSSASAARVA